MAPVSPEVEGALDTGVAAAARPARLGEAASGASSARMAATSAATGAASGASSWAGRASSMSSSGWRFLLTSAVAGSGGTTAPASPDARSSGSVAVLWSTSCACLGPRRSTLVLRLPMKLVLGSLI